MGWNKGDFVLSAWGIRASPAGLNLPGCSDESQAQGWLLAKVLTQVKHLPPTVWLETRIQKSHIAVNKPRGRKTRLKADVCQAQQEPGPVGGGGVSVRSGPASVAHATTLGSPARAPG